MKSKRTFVLLMPGFPKDAEDSTCLPSHQLFIRTMNRVYPDLNVVIVSFQYPYEEMTYSWLGNCVYASGGRNKAGLRRWMLWKKIRKQLDVLHENHDILGVLSCWAGECAYVGAKWANRTNVMHYTWLMGQDAKYGNKYVKRSGIKAAQVIALSDFLSGLFYQNYGLLPAAIIPLGVEPRHPTNDPRNIDILCAGSLIQLKRYDVVIELTKELVTDFPRLRVLICGTGPEKTNLQSLISLYGLEDNVLLAGEKPHPEILSLMQQSKLFLHPSSFEGLGMVCLEALAAGSPVISLQQPMMREIENWFVVKNKHEMLQKTRELLKLSSDHKPILPYLMEDTIKRILLLFNYKPVQTDHILSAMEAGER